MALVFLVLLLNDEPRYIYLIKRKVNVNTGDLESWSNDHWYRKYQRKLNIISTDKSKGNPSTGASTPTLVT